MNQGTIYVDCPCCGTRIEVRKSDGKVVEHWAKKKAVEGGDPLKAAAERLKAEKEKRKNYLANAQEIIEEQKRRAREKFDAEKERIAREKDFTRPDNPFDLD